MWAAQSNQSSIRELQTSDIDFETCRCPNHVAWPRQCPPTGVSTETPFPSFITVFFLDSMASGCCGPIWAMATIPLNFVISRKNWKIIERNLGRPKELNESYPKRYLVRCDTKTTRRLPRASVSHENEIVPDDQRQTVSQSGQANLAELE